MQVILKAPISFSFRPNCSTPLSPGGFTPKIQFHHSPSLVLATLNMPTPDTVRFVDTYDKLHACLEDVESIPTPHSVAVDLEGVCLGRHGRIAIMQLHAQHSNTVWLIDVTTLGARVFDEACSRGKTLRGLLEGLHIRKVSSLACSGRKRVARLEIYIK
jgi:hypothetical protein